jgi:hypothetical protein
VRSTKDEEGVIDIGWCDGVLSDSRAFRAEMWAQEQISMLTIFFSSIGINELDQDAICRFVQDEGLVSFSEKADPKYCSSAKFIDDAGNQLWSVNIVVGDEETAYLANSIPIFPYSKIGEPNTMFQPVPISAAHAAKVSKS